MKISNQIYEIIKSLDFKNRLEKINSNYSNLKQEGVIRNAILEQFNDLYANENIRAFAEHPRVNNTRVDLSIVNRAPISVPYKIEFKHHFSNHDKCFANYGKRIQKEFIDRSSDMFILVVQIFDSDKKKIFDDSWNITTSFWKKKELNEKWKLNLNRNFEEVIKISKSEFEKDSILLDNIIIEIDNPYPSKYHFYILKKID